MTGSKGKGLISSEYILHGQVLGAVAGALVLACRAPCLGVLVSIVWSAVLTGPWAASVEVLDAGMQMSGGQPIAL